MKRRFVREVKRRSRIVAWNGGSWVWENSFEDPEAAGAQEINRPMPQGIGRGWILGRFMPPHLGHQFLIDFARQVASDLTALVFSSLDDPIPGELRFQWLGELFPDVHLVHVANQPGPVGGDLASWQKGLDAIRERLPVNPDYLFASEEYGPHLAGLLGAKYVPVDPGRRTVPVSGAMIRQDPLANWKYLPACARPYFVRRLCLLGPESTSKTAPVAQIVRGMGLGLQDTGDRLAFR
jgi:NadR type nicotinamide-nucleotide adenylyltransferase